MPKEEKRNRMLERSPFQLLCKTFRVLSLTKPHPSCCQLRWGQPKPLRDALQSEGWELLPKLIKKATGALCG